MSEGLSRAIERLANIRTMIADDHRSPAIPRIIHQTYKTHMLPDDLKGNIKLIKTINPGWDHRLYNDDEIIDFIDRCYGPDILSLFNRINPHYGAARADLFRYLVMFKTGGVYLDIKSVPDRPFDDVIDPHDAYVLAHWRNGPGEAYERHGIHNELASFSRGEFQQWHIICQPGHPFLEAVITRIIGAIERYRPWRDDIGKQGVLRLTGPIAYTLAIAPILADHPHRFVPDEGVLGLRYSAFPRFSHLRFFSNHYTTRLDSIVAMTGWAKIGERLYRVYRTVRQVVARRVWYPIQQRRISARQS